MVDGLDESLNEITRPNLIGCLQDNNPAAVDCSANIRTSSKSHHPWRVRRQSTQEPLLPLQRLYRGWASTCVHLGMRKARTAPFKAITITIAAAGQLLTFELNTGYLLRRAVSPLVVWHRWLGCKMRLFRKVILLARRTHTVVLQS